MIPGWMRLPDSGERQAYTHAQACMSGLVLSSSLLTSQFGFHAEKLKSSYYLWVPQITNSNVKYYQTGIKFSTG